MLLDLQNSNHYCNAHEWQEWCLCQSNRYVPYKVSHFHWSLMMLNLQDYHEPHLDGCSLCCIFPERCGTAWPFLQQLWRKISWEVGLLLLVLLELWLLLLFSFLRCLSLLWRFPLLEVFSHNIVLLLWCDGNERNDLKLIKKKLNCGQSFRQW
jgi:hypothetical protein